MEQTSDELMLYSASVYVIRTDQPDRLMSFFAGLGLSFKAEKHGKGPEHWACQVGDFVLEIYPLKKKPEP